MKFFEDLVGQAAKSGNTVCGDTYLCERTLDHTEFVLCDGIGTGIYANIAAISCASRLMELFRSGVSQELACEMVAESMHRARKEDIPFSAFTAARILNDGQFTVYSYEAPAPIALRHGTASALKPHFHTTGEEAVGESSGTLSIGDSLILCTDGITQAGTGSGYTFGIGEDNIADFLNMLQQKNVPFLETAGKIIDLTESISKGRHNDDKTVAILNCRNAVEVNVLTGPPSQKSKDRAFVERFMSLSGTRVVCGSTTAEILSRELKHDIRLKSVGASLARPPEYEMDGISIITEGAVALNQMYNILGENPDCFVSSSPVERLCALLAKADVITFMVGRSINKAHMELLFKQLGIRPREPAIRLITKRLKEMGKLVVEEYY